MRTIIKAQVFTIGAIFGLVIAITIISRSARIKIDSQFNQLDRIEQAIAQCTAQHEKAQK